MSYIRHSRVPESFRNVQGLTPAMARVECASRRNMGEALLEFYRVELTVHGLPPDQQLDTLVDIFVYMTDKLRLEREVPPDDLPKWLDDLKDEPIWDFDAASVLIVEALGFYLGNTLIKNMEGLEWRVGNKSRAYFGEPFVATHHKTKIPFELPVMQVASTICNRYLSEGRKRAHIDDPIWHNIEWARRATKQFK